MRRLALVAAVLVLPALPVLAAAPAFAVDNVICVNNPGGACDQSFATLKPAVDAANLTAKDDLIRIAPGTYSDGPYMLNGGANTIRLQGAGQGTDPLTSTIITLPASASIQNYVLATKSTVQNLRILMTGGANSNDTGLYIAGGGAADHVTVAGAATVNSTGVHIVDGALSTATVEMSLLSGPGARAVYAEGGSTVSDSTIVGNRGVVQSAGAKTDTLSRVTIRAGDRGIVTDGGTITVDDTLIDMGSGGGTGIAAENFNASATPKTINVNHVTVVGSGAGSRGIVAYAADPDGKQAATINVTNSVVRGPATSLVAAATNDGAQGGASNATINVSYSGYELATTILGANGTGGVVMGVGNLPVGTDPKFVNPAGDYHLAVGSPLVDKGSAAAGGPALDRDGAARVTDGDGNGTVVRDLGAYERPTSTPPSAPDKTAPDTTITKKPAKRSTKKKAKLAFTSEAGATFQCRLDGGAWKTCTSPTKLKVKKGKHTFSVRAVDAAGNVDATPATVTFKRVRKPS